MLKSYARFSMACLLMLLVGCGFHLRGVAYLPKDFKRVYIINKEASPAFVRRLTSLLDTYHISTVDTPQEANYIITLEKDDFNQSLSSVSSSTTPRQYLLYYHVMFEVTDKDGRILTASQTVSVQRQVTINVNRILGSNFERSTIQREMHINAAEQLLTRIEHHESRH